MLPHILPYGRQTIEEDDIQAVVDVLKGDYLTTGPAVEAFEERIGAVTGAKYAVACANGTVALHLACIAAELQEGSCAIVPTMTFLATANAVRYCGADVVFCDADPKTGLMTEETFLKALAEADSKNFKVKAVIPVHLGGQPVDLMPICKIAHDQNIKIIADASHAIGGVYKDHPVGACDFEDMSTFSFHPVKTIAMGEGGAITTNDPDLASKMKRYRQHCMVKTEGMEPWAYEMNALGYNYRVTDIQCVLGLSQLNKIERFITKRESLVSLYTQMLEGLNPYIKSPCRVQKDRIGWHLYAIRIDFEALGISRAEIMARLKAKNVGTQVHYIPVHTQPYYKALYGEQDFTGATHYYNQTLSLPLYPAMEEADVTHVVNALKDSIE